MATRFVGKRGRPLLGLAALWMTVAAIVRPALAADPRGTWLTEDKDAALTISACGSQLCGRIIWLESATDRRGMLRRDKNNPDPGKQSQRVCGLVIIKDLTPSGPGTWAGTVYNPEDGQTYQGSITVLSHDALRVRAYVALPIFGRHETWTRVTGPAANGLAYDCRPPGEAAASADLPLRRACSGNLPASRPVHNNIAGCAGGFRDVHTRVAASWPDRRLHRQQDRQQERRRALTRHRHRHRRRPDRRFAF